MEVMASENEKEENGSAPEVPQTPSESEIAEGDDAENNSNDNSENGEENNSNGDESEVNSNGESV